MIQRMILLTHVLSLFYLSNIFARDFEVPTNFKMETKTDYEQYESQVLECIDYLENSPLNKDIEKRKQASTFLMKWISGTPKVKIVIEGYLLDLVEKNSDFIMIFIGGWTRYALENPDQKDSLLGNLAGLKSIIKVYTSGEGVKKDDKVQKLVKMDEKNKLETWLKSKIQKDK
ncbi:hypothetical protein JW964_07525 [candidate division KSB1 bacterium]|nr:hypothetical protein [candidate division KSB1 bacterium]